MNLNYLDIVFFAVVAIQLIYWIIWLIGIFKIPTSTISNAQHGVSVVIAANNQLKNLQQLIPLLTNQNYGLFEIIIINDRSTDGTYDYLLEIAQNNELIKVLTVSELPSHLNGKKYALTLGIKSANYDQILLSDADCYPNSNEWISSFANSWKEKVSFVLGFSFYKKHPGILNYFIRFETILTGIQYLSAASLGKPYMGVGRNLSYSKSLFLSKKGFHGFQDLMGGDDDIFVNKYANSSNTSVQLKKESSIISYPKTTLKEYIIQKTRHLSVGKHYSIKSKIILAFFTLTWILTWGLFPFELIITQHLLPVVLLIGIRYIFMGISIALFTKKSGTNLNLLGLILLDFMFVLYYFVTGMRALLIKRIKWS